MDTCPSLLPDQAVERVAAYFRALSDPTRLRILIALREREHSVGELARRVHCSQANISKHLAVLLDAGIIARTMRRTTSLLNIADYAIFGLCETVCDSIASSLERDLVLHQALNKSPGKAH